MVGASRFREIVFRCVPLIVLATASVAGAVCGPEWSKQLGPWPWLVSLGIVGLPHGAADFAASRMSFHGWSLAIVWLAYAAVMAAVALGFAAAPLASIALFAAVSCWHFGAAHADAEGHADSTTMRAVGALARGAAVLAMPLAVWPEATATAASELATVTTARVAAPEFMSPGAVQAIGLILAAVAIIAASVEGVVVIRKPAGWRGWLRLLVELSVIMSLGWFTDPLFSVGMYFLVWHAWRQMEPLAKSLRLPPSRSWHGFVHTLARIHVLALPLLIPTWAMIAFVWWQRSPDHTLRDLAIISIGAYLVVTPAHELLGDVLRRTCHAVTVPASFGGRRSGRRNHLPFLR